MTIRSATTEFVVATDDTDQAAFEAFCRRERPRLVGALTLYCGDVLLAEEVAQEALLAACRDWSRLQRMRAPGAWAHRVAMNIVNSAIRRRYAERRALRRHGPDRDRYELPDVASAVRVREAVRKLPDDQRAVVVLRFYADLSAAEVGEVMGRTSEAVRALTHRAVVALRAAGLDVEEADDA